ncbi:MAG: ABC transporter substrate binding protein [Pseudomonadota bacterium]
MVMLRMRTTNSAERLSRRRIAMGTWLLVGSLLSGAVSPVMASSLASAAVTPAYSPQTDNFAEIVREIEAYPDVVVFPIHVAETVNIAASRRLSNKVAQAAADGAITVLYPDIGEPYRSVFTQIIDGIQAKARGQVSNIAVGPKTDLGELRDTLRRQESRVVIALGRQGLKTASALNGDIGVVVGGVLSASDDETRNAQVNSLSPDPALLFSRLKGMMPKVRRIYTVYDPRQNEWLIRLARDGAREQGLELVAYEAQDLRAAMHAYQEIMAKANSSSEAIWLPQDSTTVEESTVLPLVLQESWARNLALFSSSFSHVKRGVLFSLYPDNVELGRHLAGDALSMMASGVPETSGMMPLREVLMAVNLRTARHLGLNPGRPQSFDMAFPEQ